MRRQAGTRTDPDALEGVAPLIGDIAACSPAVTCAERGRIERLLALGARRAGVGQTGAGSWAVLADPEGNEFCSIRPKERSPR
jgi:glyoxalase superfamily protein